MAMAIDKKPINEVKLDSQDPGESKSPIAGQIPAKGGPQARQTDRGQQGRFRWQVPR
jgi:hypothetical protein